MREQDVRQVYRAGVDVGSTTVKLAVLGAEGELLYGAYRRHGAHIQESLALLLEEAQGLLGDAGLRLCVTGSGSISLGRALHLGFVQEVEAVAAALEKLAPQTDVAIELGGEDAKIIYFRGGMEERMNGVCAGGTGSFIDQMAALLQTDAMGLNELAARHSQIHPIAARCGVFAKSDIQPLINEGAAREDLAASVFQAVVNQTISGLACGRPIRGCVAFLGGPLHFLSELKAAFIRSLHLAPQEVVDPENAHLFAAIGAALSAGDAEAVRIGALCDTLRGGLRLDFEIKRLEPLFADEADYAAFRARHDRAVVRKAPLAEYSGDCFLGIDAGSTTTKLALIGGEGELLYSFYSNNRGDPVRTALQAVEELRVRMPKGARIARACSTGYGEALLKTAFSLDEGEVETIAHCTAAAFFDPAVDCVLDIGGQDMKCIRLKNGAVESIMLNEACSSGCGSFLENFAVSLGYSVEDFAREALRGQNPVDLGTRCTVFMNSNVKQAQKEGAPVADISAGLAYSVIKNALFKVIKLVHAADLGAHVVVQGGTFHNEAVLRAFEKVAGVEAVCPDIAGLMGAFGAALIARERYSGQESAMPPLETLSGLSYSSTTTRCGRCENNCMLTVNRFSSGKRHITGNRCERALGGVGKERAPSLYAYKAKRMFDYAPLEAAQAPRGVIGVPRVLNLYENYPYWATFFRELGFRVLLSPFSDAKLYELGMESIPSESECYPAKLAHGHVQWLLNQGVKTIFHPCVFYERQEQADAQNHYNCPIVSAYPENLKNNLEGIGGAGVRYIRPFIALRSAETAAERLVRLCREEWGIAAVEVRRAAHMAWQEQLRAKADVVREGKRLLAQMEAEGAKGVVLAGRPYHVDPQVHHGIPDMIASYGLYVFSEDSLPIDFRPARPLRVNDQWVYHSRLYAAAEFVSRRDDLELVQLNSFGCGLDAVTTDEVAEILEGSGKLYTVLKIDEVSNLGAARIRIRSLMAAMRWRAERGLRAKPQSPRYIRSEFRKEMFEAGYTILAPQMSPIHFDFLEPVFHHFGYRLELLHNDNRAAIDVGLQFVNNDACFPSITVVGQIMEAVLSGRYDTDRLAIIMTQTGGCCRASNYIAFIRRALDKTGLSHIPVISLNANGMEKNEGFKPSLRMWTLAAKAVVYGDLCMRCLYRTRPYEKVPGSAEALAAKWRDICAASLTRGGGARAYGKICAGIVADFDALELDESRRKPRVGIVGEILVKYMPLANNKLVELLEREGAEAVVPDLADFLNYSLYGYGYRHEFLGDSWKSALTSFLGVRAIRAIRAPALRALGKSRRFAPPPPIEEIAALAKPFLSIGNQYGEGWFLTGEMVELLKTGVPNIVCVQPFACLPNHVVGKGVIKALKKACPEANIVAVDYDPGASEVNQLNRIKLMLAAARKNLAVQNNAPLRPSCHTTRYSV